MGRPDRAGGAVRHDVVVVGDGPAGSALASALVDHDVDVVLVGDDRPWGATYGAWVDELPPAVSGLVRSTCVPDAIGERWHTLARRYAVLDNDRLRSALRRAPHVVGRAAHWTAITDGASVALDAGTTVAARLVIDASGWAGTLLRPPAPRRARRSTEAWQTAYGLVLARPPSPSGERAVLMDWRPPAAHLGGDPTFLYAAPLDGGRWLVEETSLARRVAMSPAELRARLAARLGEDLTDRAEHVEHVVIPMRTELPDARQRVVGFGAAASYVHPATGYSVTASLRAAPHVARAVAHALGADLAPEALAARAWSAVWPASARRSRHLHERGLDAVLRMRAPELRRFFDAFFELPVDAWAAYLRIDAPPRDVARAMARVFSALPWSARKRLVVGRPLPSVPEPWDRSIHPAAACSPSGAPRAPTR